MSKKLYVADASVMAKWLRTEKEEYIEQANAMLEDLQNGNIEIYAPELAKYEIGNFLKKRKLLSYEAKSSLATYYSLPITFLPETKELADKTYQFADELHITYYDAAYLSLAEELKSGLITENVKHHGKATTIKIIPLAHYKKSEAV